MIVRFRMSKDAAEAKELASKLQSEHYCPLGGPDGLIGFVRKVEEQGDQAYVTAEINDPDTVADITKRYGYTEPVEVNLDAASANSPLLSYMRSRFPPSAPQIRLHTAGER